MKYSLTCLLTVFIFLSACENQENKNVQNYLSETARLYRENTDDTAAIAQLLTEGLVVYPNSIPLLQSRANLYCSRGMLGECRADTLRLLQLKPNSTEGRMMLCMLDEFEGAGEQHYEACYLDVVNLFGATSTVASQDVKNTNKFNYVIALLMANHPDANREKEVFLSSVVSDDNAWIYEGVLNNFDRKRVLSEIFNSKSSHR